MTDDALCRLSAVGLARMIRAREVSPLDVMRAVLDRAERLQPSLNPFITLDGEAALAAAARAEQAVMEGGTLGLLHGIPVSVKDIVNTAGLRTTFGSLLFEDNVPAEDAVAIARLRAAGAIVFAKTTTPEFGTKCLTDSPLFGRTPNAWSLAHSSGGSSGGAAVAVASGIGPLAVATDGGGSTRIPAAVNGMVGLKQSLGTVPHSQVPDAFGNYTYVTPMTRDVADTALMLQAMAGPDASDPWSIGVPVPDYPAVAAASHGGLSGVRILAAAAPPGRPISAAVQGAFDQARVTFRGLGAEIGEFDGAAFDVEPIWRAINHTTWRARFQPMADRDPDRLSETFLRQLSLARDVSGMDYQQAMFDRARLFRHVQSLFDVADYLLTPTLSRPALPIDQDLFDPLDIDGVAYPDVRANWFPWTMPFNLTGHPAVTVNAGFSLEGLPIGLQIVGRFRADADLLRIAALFEGATGLVDRRPADPA